MDVSVGEVSHEWHLLKYNDKTKEWCKMDDFDLQFIRTNSGIPSTILEDFDPEEYMIKKTPMPSPTSIKKYFSVL